MNMENVLSLSPGLAASLAAIVVHAEELISADGHPFDKDALQTALSDPKVREWIKACGALAPVKRVNR